MKRTRARQIASLILILGFGAALAIYVTAEAPDPNPLGYDPMTDRKYLHDLEIYGGKANVMAAQFREWFAGLWHGPALAGTIAVLTVALAVMFWWLATIPRDEKREP